MTQPITTNLTLQFNTLVKAAEANRVSTKKLIAAANAVGDAIESLVPVDVPLPRHYSRSRLRSREGSVTFLFRGCTCDDQYGCQCDAVTGAVNCEQSGYLHGDFQAPILVPTSRALALAFARDVASGLIGEIAAVIDARAAEAEAGANVLVQAAADLGVEVSS